MSDEQPIETRSGKRAGQDEAELAWLIGLLQRRSVLRYLEIGARHGDGFFRVMNELPLMSYGVAVDLPGDVWGKPRSEVQLLRAAELLNAGGRKAEVILGNSRHTNVQAAVAARAPFDAIFIDADHRYDGVTADWTAYGRHAPLVAFHDIAPIGEAFRSRRLEVGVPRFWQELRACAPAGATFMEHVTDRGEKGGGGIGVILRAGA